MSRLRRLLWICLLTLSIGYAALVVAAFSFQRSLLFPAPTSAREPRHATILRLADGGVTMFLAPQPGFPTLVYFHGNAQQLSDVEWLGEQLAKPGFGFLAVEYPGYGLTNREVGPSEQGCYAAAEAALRFVEQSTPREQIVLVGQSLGTGVAVEMATRGHGRALVLITPYTSIPAMAGELLPFLPTRLLVRDRFDNLAKAGVLPLPVLVVHGTADELVPTAMGQTLAHEFPHAQLVLVDGGHHNDLLDREEVLQQIFSFIQR